MQTPLSHHPAGLCSQPCFFLPAVLNRPDKNLLERQNNQFCTQPGINPELWDGAVTSRYFLHHAEAATWPYSSGWGGTTTCVDGEEKQGYLTFVVL